MRVLTPINGCHSNANNVQAWMMFILVKVKYFLIHHKETPQEKCKFGLCSHTDCSIHAWTLFDVYGILCICLVRNVWQFTYSKCKVVGLLWFAHFGMRDLWRCSIIELFPSSESHKRFAHLPSEFDGSKVFLGGFNMAFFLCTPSFKCYKLKPKALFMPIFRPFVPQNISSHTFRNPRRKKKLF